MHMQRMPAWISSGSSRSKSLSGAPALVSCAKLNEELIKIDAEIKAGVISRPTRGQLQIELSQRLGVRQNTVNHVLYKRCKHLYSLYESMSVRDAGHDPSFSCEQLEEILRTADDHRAANLAKLLSTETSQITPASIQTALHTRCRHLKPLWKSYRGNRGRGK